MNFPFGETVTLTLRTVTGQDGDGNDVYGVTTGTVAGCGFDPGLSSEIIAGRDTVTTQPTLYLPAGTLVAAADKVTVRGLAYEVDGQPTDWRSPLTGWAAGLVLKLRRVTG